MAPAAADPIPAPGPGAAMRLHARGPPATTPHAAAPETCRDGSHLCFPPCASALMRWWIRRRTAHVGLSGRFSPSAAGNRPFLLAAWRDQQRQTVAVPQFAL